MSMKIMPVIVAGVLAMAPSAVHAQQPSSAPATPSKVVVKVAKDRILVPGGIHFDAGKASIHKDSLPALNAAAKVLAKRKRIDLVIGVHTDARGSSGYNLRLSQDRANAVASYLVSQGVDAKRLVAKGYGETRPIADNQTAAGRAKNSRVELLIRRTKVAAR